MNTKMGKKVLKFGNIKIEKQEFFSAKKGIHINRVRTNKIGLSEGFTYLLIFILLCEKFISCAHNTIWQK